MSFEIEGRLHKLFATESKTESFKTREFVLEIASGNYPQVIKFQTTQDKCAMLDAYNEGDGIKVYFDLRGREWNEKYLTNLNAWRIEASSGATAEGPSAAPAAKASSKPATQEFPIANDEPPMPFGDDLPF
jgi:single-strand DNA-binding protein